MEQALSRDLAEPRRVKEFGRQTPPPRDAVNAPQTFAIAMSRLPGVDNAPGLILLTVDVSGKAPKRVGTVTDAGLRGRLAHFDAHRANEIAAIRQALATESGEATVYESWPGLARCLQFWHGFTGSQIRPIEWTCEKCGASGSVEIGGSVGESVVRRCACGQANRMTVPKYMPSHDHISPRGMLTGPAQTGPRKVKKILVGPRWKQTRP